MDLIADYVAAYAPTDRRVPMVRLNMIASLDGAVTLDGHAGGLGGPADQKMMILLRMLADVIIVGANTVRIEGYQGDLIDEPAKRWRVEHGLTLIRGSRWLRGVQADHCRRCWPSSVRRRCCARAARTCSARWGSWTRSTSCA